MAAMLVSSILCDDTAVEHRNVEHSKLSNLLRNYKKSSVDATSDEISDDLFNFWLEQRLAEKEGFQRFIRKSPKLRKFWKRGPGVQEELSNFW
jgi:hypothetical protein